MQVFVRMGIARSSVRVPLLVGVLSMTPSTALGAARQVADPDDGRIAGVGEAADAAELVPAAASGLPPILPGQQPGAHGKPESGQPEPAVPVAAPREWFGLAPWSGWTRLTGDWNGARTALEDAGIDFNGSLVSEWSDVFSGGATGSASSAFRHLLDLNIAFDLATIARIERARVFVDFQTGDTGVGGLLHGGYQAYSNIAIEGSITQLSQCYYEQWFAGDALRVKIGKVDANTEFAFISAASGFIDASAGFSPAIFALPTYPNPAMSANLFVYPDEHAYFGAGVYDGAFAADGVATGSLGPAGFFSDDGSDDWFVIGEGGYTFDRVGPFSALRVAAGAWWHSGEFERFDGGTDDGTAGFYAMAEGRAWHPSGAEAVPADDPRGLWMFLQYGWANEQVSVVSQQFGAGAALRGTFAGRDDDGAGVYLSYLDFSGDPAAGYGPSECVVELYYDIAVTPWLHLKPDLQWFVDPSGGASDDSLVGTLRCSLAF